jgi:protein-S-isoprenylcysteine O-methyltransferase Ste14
MALQEEFTRQGQWLFRYRGIVPIVILIVGLGVYLYVKSGAGNSFLGDQISENTYEIFALSVSLLGLFVRIYTVGHSPRNTSGRNVKQQVADTLNTSGSYSLVRHPLYVGNFLMWLGAALLTENIWFLVIFCLSFWLYYERIMFAEEQFLRGKFGDPYLEWAEKVPPFIPRFKGFIPPGSPFSWKKVLRKEKNGLAATFLVFFAFDVAGELIRREENYNRFIAAGAAVTILLYIVLTYLKRRTGVLKEKG